MSDQPAEEDPSQDAVSQKLGRKTPRLVADFDPTDRAPPINMAKKLLNNLDQLCKARRLERPRILEDCVKLWFWVFVDQLDTDPPKLVLSQTGNSLTANAERLGCSVDDLVRIGASCMAALTSEDATFQSIRNVVLKPGAKRSWGQEMVARLKLAEQLLEVAPNALDAMGLPDLKSQLKKLK